MGIPMLEIRSLTKRFPGVVALREASMEVQAGEIHALVGENGAGKSTLLSILFGLQTRDGGAILLQGKPIEPKGPAEAQRLGISLVPQEPQLVPELDVAHNLLLGREPRRRWRALVHRRRLYEEARRILDRLGAELDLRKPALQLGAAEQQIVEIARALLVDAKVIAFDEPTASLSPAEAVRLFEVIRGLRGRGLSIIYVTHRLDEVFELADRVTVLRDGMTVATRPIGSLTKDDVVRMMVGRHLGNISRRCATAGARTPRGPVLRVEGLTREPHFRDISFTLHEGEILTLAGLVGSGRTEVARAIFGADPVQRGRVYVDGSPVLLRSPADAIRVGIGLLPEDRKLQGLLMQMSVCSNVTMAALSAFASRYGFVKRAARLDATTRLLHALRVRPAEPGVPVFSLSGGNQQKVILARWLCTRSRVLIFDEPTRGVDVGAKEEIYQLMTDFVSRGNAILMVSSDLPEVLRMSDRILVMRQGQIVGSLSGETATQEAIMRIAAGEKTEE